MRILLDTHALLWMNDTSDRLSATAASAILDVRNDLLLSVASWWEIAIKISLGKLDLKPEWPTALKREMNHNGITWLPVRPEHCERIPQLPFHHRDPFDRILIAQAQHEDLVLITSDQCFVSYGVTVIW
ncbi:MAG: type II toxin-antitoxin system VapC family toxin [bacterium]